MNAWRSKKSEMLEVRVSHDVKQAFMQKAAGEGRSASEIVRRSIADYLHEGRSSSDTPVSGLLRLAGLGLGAIVFLFGYSISSSAAGSRDSKFEAAKARLTLEQLPPAQRRKVVKHYAGEFAAQRMFVMDPTRPGAAHAAFASLDLDFDGRLSLTEYRQLMTVPAGSAGQKMFETEDRNRDGRLSEGEFRL